MKMLRGETFLCGGAFSEVSVTVSEPSSAVNLWSGPRDGSKVPLRSCRSEKRATQREIKDSEGNSLVEDLCGNSPEIGEIRSIQVIDNKQVDSLAEQARFEPSVPFPSFRIAELSTKQLNIDTLEEQIANSRTPNDEWRAGGV
jgi:hypothetical protein